MTLLILGGTSEARKLAEVVAIDGRQAILSLAGATRHPIKGPLPTRVGGFGGGPEFLTYLREKGISAVLDATHPFAAKITKRTFEICLANDIAYAQLLRPKWTPQAGDIWTEINNEQEAANHIAKGSTIFLGTGRQTLAAFSNLEGCRVICRQIDPPTKPFPFEGGEFLVGRPPFPVNQEKELFQRLRIDWLVVKNAGGAASYTKLAAARDLRIPVLMIRRPEMPDAKRVETVDQAMAWINSL